MEVPGHWLGNWSAFETRGYRFILLPGNARWLLFLRSQSLPRTPKPLLFPEQDGAVTGRPGHESRLGEYIYCLVPSSPGQANTGQETMDP
jgi:hypothetical protein